MRTTAAVFAALLALSAPAIAQERVLYTGERAVTMTGQAEIATAPDQAWVTVGIEARALKSQDAQKRAADVMTRIRAEVAALGIPEAAVRTVSFNLHADWNYVSNKRTLRGYVVSNIVEVRVDDISKVADVLDRSISAGGNAIHGIRWDIKDRVKVEREALRLAVTDAKQRAEIAAAAAGGTVGAVSMISEQRYEMRSKMDMRMANAGGAAVEVQAATPISAGEIDVRATVTVTFRIE